MLTAGMLRKLTAAPDTVGDDVLQFILDGVAETILAYCNRSDIPHQLETTAYRMAADVYRHEGYGTDASGASGPVQSVKTGDTDVTYRDPTSGADYEAYLASILHNYTAMLNRYRKLGWPKCHST